MHLTTLEAVAPFEVGDETKIGIKKKEGNKEEVVLVWKVCGIDSFARIIRHHERGYGRILLFGYRYEAGTDQISHVCGVRPQE